jgi:hypothetical protein
MVMLPLAQADVDKAQFIQMSPSIAKVEALDSSGRFGIGTGVTVAPGLVATNCHVTRRAQEIRVVKGGVRFAVVSQIADIKHDLCLLKAPGWKSKPVELGATGQLHRGQQVAGLGYVGGVDLTMREGMIVDLHLYDDAAVIQTDASFTSGASGGGLFDEAGRLIGWMTFRLRGGNNHYFVIPVDWLHELMGKQSENIDALEPTGQMAFWEQTAERQPYFLQAISLKQNMDWPALQMMAERWSALEPVNAHAWYSKGEALIHTGDMKLSLESLNKAVKLDPVFAAAWYLHGLASWRLGGRALSLKALSQLDLLDGTLAAQLRDVIKD